MCPKLFDSIRPNIATDRGRKIRKMASDLKVWILRIPFDQISLPFVAFAYIRRIY